MKATEFCYWLQGMFEINPPTNGLSAEQVKIIMAHLNMVFYHEIDKSYPDNEQNKLNDLHQEGSKTDNEKFNELLKKIAEENKKINLPPQFPPIVPYYLEKPVCGDDVPSITLNTPIIEKDDTTPLMRC